MSDIIPEGFCQCGCGEKTNIASATQNRIGWVKGKPIRYRRGHQRRKSPVEYVLEDRGYETPCWIWQRSMTERGYGKKTVKGRTIRAHRLYYERKYGTTGPGVEFHHRCEVKACVNPEHLQAITRIEHANQHAQVTPGEVQRIRQMLDKGEMSQRQIAEIVGVSPQHISSINVGIRRAQVGE